MGGVVRLAARTAEQALPQVRANDGSQMGSVSLRYFSQFENAAVLKGAWQWVLAARLIRLV